MTQWVEGRLVGRRSWTDNLHTLLIDAPVEPFQAGQATRLAMDIEGEQVARYYSYVNAPHERHLEFYFVSTPERPFTERLQRLRIGDTILVSPKSTGNSTLAVVPDARHLWLLATGTALGAFLSLLKTEEPWQRFEEIVLVHAVRTAEELTYRKVIRGFNERYPDRLTVVPFVSRQQAQFALQGRIPEAIGDGRLERRAGLALDPDCSQVMVCGNPGMVEDATVALEARGFRKNTRERRGQITSESYW